VWLRAATVVFITVQCYWLGSFSNAAAGHVRTLVQWIIHPLDLDRNSCFHQAQPAVLTTHYY
jgi:hypothetical protein